MPEARLVQHTGSWRSRCSLCSWRLRTAALAASAAAAASAVAGAAPAVPAAAAAQTVLQGPGVPDGAAEWNMHPAEASATATAGAAAAAAAAAAAGVPACLHSCCCGCARSIAPAAPVPAPTAPAASSAVDRCVAQIEKIHAQPGVQWGPHRRTMAELLHASAWGKAVCLRKLMMSLSGV